MSTSPSRTRVALRLNGMYENSDSFRDGVDLERGGVNPTLTFTPGRNTTMTVGYEHLHDTRVADRGITSFQGRPADVDPSTFYGNPDDSHVHADVNLGSVTLEHRTGSVTIRNRTLIGDYDRSYQNFVPGAVTRGREPGLALRLQQRNESDELLQPDRPDVREIHRTADAHAARRRRGRPAADGQLPQYRLLQQHRDVDSRAVRFTHDLNAGDVPPERDRRRQSRDHERRRRLCAGSGRASRATSRWSAACGSIASISSTTTTATATRSAASTISSRRERASSSSRSSRCRSTAATACRICRARAISSPR